jgi:hypothetical protein
MTDDNQKPKEPKKLLRHFVQYTASHVGFLAVANDGTAWYMERDGKWHQNKDLPQPEDDHAAE